MDGKRFSGSVREVKSGGERAALQTLRASLKAFGSRGSVWTARVFSTAFQRG